MTRYDLGVYYTTTVRQTKGKGKAVEASLSAEEVKRCKACLSRVAALGYRVVAWTQVVNHTDLDQVWCPPARLIEDDASSILQLNRLDIITDDVQRAPLGMHPARTEILKSFDIIGVRPLTASAFQYACISASAPSNSSVDVIALDLSNQIRLSFVPKRSAVQKALQHGVMFDLQYGQMIQSDVLRKNFLSNARDLVRVTGGQGLICSSGRVTHALQFRAPEDVGSLLGMAGLKSDQARDAMIERPRRVLERAQRLRKDASAKGVFMDFRRVEDEDQKVPDTHTDDAISQVSKKKKMSAS